MNTGATSADGLTPEVIDSVRTSLDRILAGQPFLGSERLRRFLRFIVEHKLSGETEKIKEYVVAVEVFDKDASFDPRIDPIVRVEAGRLRSKLREYYETEGQADRVRIDLPKGGYVPVFQTGNAQVLGAADEESPPSETLSHGSFRGRNGSELPGNGAAPKATIDLEDLEGTPTLSIEAAIGEPKQRYRYAWAAVTVGVLIAVGSTYWMSQRAGIETTVSPLVVPFTTYSGGEGDPSFSPDGNQVAFVWDGQQSDNSDIYVKQIGTESTRRLTTNSKPDFSPTWSPDGQSIAFVRKLGPGKSAVLMVAVNGGREQLVAELRTRNVPLGCRWISWHPGGKWLAVASDQESEKSPAAIYLLSKESGEIRRLTSPPDGSSLGAHGDTNPAFSADGHNLVFVRFSATVTSELFLLRMSDGPSPEGEPKQLTSGNKWTVTPAWMPDGQSIIYASGSHIHSANLWKISIANPGKPKPVAVSGRGPVVDPAISPASGRLVYRSYSKDVNIWRNQIPGEKENPVPPAKLMPSTMVQEAAQYSPDGKAVAFVSYASGNGEIWVCDSDGSNPSQLTHLDGVQLGGLRWSPKGQHIVFSLPSNGRLSLYSVSAQGGQVKRLTDTRFKASDASYSRDGRWLYFGSDRSGDSQIWRMPAEGGDAVQITRRGGHSQLESMDGKTLFYLKSNDADFGDLWKMPTGGGEESRVLRGVLHNNFDPKERGIYYATHSSSKETQFLFQDFKSGESKHLATVARYVGWGFTVSPDEQWILSTQSGGSGGSDLELVENFR